MIDLCDLCVLWCPDKGLRHLGLWLSRCCAGRLAKSFPYESLLAVRCWESSSGPSHLFGSTCHFLRGLKLFAEEFLVEPMLNLCWTYFELCFNRLHVSIDAASGWTCWFYIQGWATTRNMSLWWREHCQIWDSWRLRVFFYKAAGCGGHHNVSQLRINLKIRSSKYNFLHDANLRLLMIASATLAGATSLSANPCACHLATSRRGPLVPRPVPGLRYWSCTILYWRDLLIFIACIKQYQHH